MNTDLTQSEKAVAEYLIQQMEELNTQQERIEEIAEYMLSVFPTLDPTQRMNELLKKFPELEKPVKAGEIIAQKMDEETKKDDIMQKLRDTINKYSSTP